MTVSDFTYASAIDLADAMAARKVSSVELTQAAIDRIERFDGKINAICASDFDQALRVAHNADKARERNEIRPLLGVPMTVKESFNVAGLPTTWGIVPFKDFRPTEDALAVARVKAAGAVILGKTNIPLVLGDVQSYNDIYGTTNNPWDLARTPGGSSGGSAAALAAGYGALSIGSDIAGSLRVPATFCGVFAHKPTFGLLPSRGHVPPQVPPLAYERDLAVIGPMARTATDLSLLFDILADPDETWSGIASRRVMPPARHQNLASYRVLVIDTHPLIPTASSVCSAIDQLVEKLSKKGVKLHRQSSLLPDLSTTARLFMRLLMSSLSSTLPLEAYAGMSARAGDLDASDLSLSAERLRGFALSHRDWLIADAERSQIRKQWQQLFVEFDAVLCPVMPTPAFEHDHSPDQWRRRIHVDGADYDYGNQLVWSGLATTPGLPATVLPIGHSDGGLPIGVQLLGPMFEDRTPLKLAELIEREFGGFVPPPLA